MRRAELSKTRWECQAGTAALQLIVNQVSEFARVVGIAKANLHGNFTKPVFSHLWHGM
jgi:hypothetical protein